VRSAVRSAEGEPSVCQADATAWRAHVPTVGRLADPCPCSLDGDDNGFSREMIEAFIDDHREAYGVGPICRVLPIAPSTCYAHKASGCARRSRRAGQ
jgi:hypothetical protein